MRSCIRIVGISLFEWTYLYVYIFGIGGKIVKALAMTLCPLHNMCVREIANERLASNKTYGVRISNSLLDFKFESICVMWAHVLAAVVACPIGNISIE